eukprot:8548225-Alexandrium_andersonii.AAC.1
MQGGRGLAGCASVNGVGDARIFLGMRAQRNLIGGAVFKAMAVVAVETSASNLSRVVVIAPVPGP